MEKNLTVSEKLEIVASETAAKLATKKGKTPGFAAGMAAKDEFWDAVLNSELGVADTVGLIRILPNDEGKELALLLYNGMAKKKKCCAGILFDRMVGEGDYKPVNARGLAPTMGGRLNKELTQVPNLLETIGVFLGGWMHFSSAAAAETFFVDLYEKLFTMSKGVLFLDSIADYKSRAAEFLEEMESEEAELHPELYTQAACKARKVFWARCGKSVVWSGNFPALLKDVTDIFSKDVAKAVSTGFTREETWKPVKFSGFFPALLEDVSDVFEKAKEKVKEALTPTIPMLEAPLPADGAWMGNLFTGEFEFVPFTTSKKGGGGSKKPRRRK